MDVGTVGTLAVDLFTVVGVLFGGIFVLVIGVVIAASNRLHGEG